MRKLLRGVRPNVAAEIWTGELGRTPDNNKRGGVYSLGRGHNADAMTMLLAGGGVKPGVVGTRRTLRLTMAGYRPTWTTPGHTMNSSTGEECIFELTTSAR